MTSHTSSAYCEKHGVNLTQNDYCALCKKGIGDLRVALCDVCDQRPGVRSVTAYGIETWACSACLGEEDALSDEEVSRG